MTRHSRIKGLEMTYHVMIRGNEKRNIFMNDSDRSRFLQILIKMKSKYNFLLEAYCLMDNHVHLLINDNNNDISNIMKSINVSYANYFNKQYSRVGHLFQDRFLSQIITDDRYLITVSAYIHNNPVRAMIVEKPEMYKWSSMNEFILKKVDSKIANPERILEKFSLLPNEAVKYYYNYVIKSEVVDEGIIDIEEDRIQIRIKNQDYIENFYDGKRVIDKELELRNSTLGNIKKDKSLRKEIMTILHKNSELTLSEIGKLCGGYSKATVSLTLKNIN